MYPLTRSCPQRGCAATMTTKKPGTTQVGSRMMLYSSHLRFTPTFPVLLRLHVHCLRLRNCVPVLSLEVSGRFSQLRANRQEILCSRGGRRAVSDPPAVPEA